MHGGCDRHLKERSPSVEGDGTVEVEDGLAIFEGRGRKSDPPASLSCAPSSPINQPPKVLVLVGHRYLQAKVEELNWPKYFLCAFCTPRPRRATSKAVLPGFKFGTRP